MGFHLHVTWSPLYELCNSLNVYRGTCNLRHIEQSAQWIKEVQQTLTPEFEQALADSKDLGCFDYIYVLIALHGSDDFETFISWLESLRPGELYELLLPYASQGLPNDFAEQRDRYAHLLRLWREQYFQHVDPHVLEMLAEQAKQWEVERGEFLPEDYIDHVTNGVYLEPYDEEKKVVLVPSYHNRPLTIHHVMQNLELLLVSVDKLGEDERTPSPLLMRMTRALADENRLKILQFLRSGPRTFTEVFQESGLTKGTVNHHLMILRTAGLIRCRMNRERNSMLYEWRFGKGEALLGLLNGYLQRTL